MACVEDRSKTSPAHAEAARSTNVATGVGGTYLGSAKPDDPIYKEGWQIHLPKSKPKSNGPFTPTPPKSDTPQLSETTKPETKPRVKFVDVQKNRTISIILGKHRSEVITAHQSQKSNTVPPNETSED